MEESSPDLERTMISHYESIEEEERLGSGSGALELVRSQELIDRALLSPPAVILDVGGGPGVYSCWLAQRGYEVHLVDPVQKHLDQAKRASKRQPDHPIASITKGDARSLDQADASADVVLLMGPLYHLTSRTDRLKSLLEAARVLRPDGVVICVGCTRFAPLLNGLVRGFIDDPYFVETLQRDLTDGQHRNPMNVAEYWTTAFLHHPVELEAEIREAGFSVQELAAVQGPGWLAVDFETRWADPGKRAQILQLVRAVEHEP